MGIQVAERWDGERGPELGYRGHRSLGLGLRRYRGAWVFRSGLRRALRRYSRAGTGQSAAAVVADIIRRKVRVVNICLAIESVGKQYRGGNWALQDFTLQLGPGVLGLLGPNGAGKSTLMRILATIAEPSRGRVRWGDVDLAREPDALRAVLGYLPQDFGVYPNLNPQEFLAYIAAAKGLPARAARSRIDDLLQLVNLVDARKRPLGGFSGGMRQRVGIAQALLNDPKLLIVDEPTAGLDPEERVRFRNLLSELSGERIIILSTHIVSDVEATATHIALINRGRLVAHAQPEQLLRSAEGKVWEWLMPSAELAAVKDKLLISGALRRSDGVRVRAVASAPPAAGAQPVAPNLEDAYLMQIAASRGAGA
jgi:ABC-type multidrug transport system ATPase subunit